MDSIYRNLNSAILPLIYFIVFHSDTLAACVGCVILYVENRVGRRADVLNVKRILHFRCNSNRLTNCS
jgi:hypothetical protein